MAVQRLAAGRIDRRRVDADQLHPAGGEPGYGLGRKGAEVGVPDFVGFGAAAHQHPFRQTVRRMLQMFDPDQRTTADRVDHPARPEEGAQVDFGNAGSIVGVMQWRIGMCAGMRRHRQSSQVDRTLRRQARGPAQ